MIRTLFSHVKALFLASWAPAGTASARPTGADAGYRRSVDDLRTPRGVRVAGKALRIEVSRSGGPGGQHVNTVSSRVTVVLDVPQGLSPSAAARVEARYGATLRVSSAKHRSQWRNRTDALARLAERIDQALEVQASRTSTRVPPRERRRRREDKQQRSKKLSNRRISPDD